MGRWYHTRRTDRRVARQGIKTSIIQTGGGTLSFSIKNKQPFCRSRQTEYQVNRWSSGRVVDFRGR